MSVLGFETNYKNSVIKLLYSNKKFIKLINPKNNYEDYLDTADVLNGGTWYINGEKIEEQGYVFDHDFVDDTITEEKTFAFVETDVDTIRDNMFVDFSLYICAFTSKKLVRLDNYSEPSVSDIKKLGYAKIGSYGNRIDALIDTIEDTILSNVDEFESLGDIIPATRGHLTRYNPNQKYYGKCLKYKISNYNYGGDNCGNN